MMYNLVKSYFFDGIVEIITIVSYNSFVLGYIHYHYAGGGVHV